MFKASLMLPLVVLLIVGCQLDQETPEVTGGPYPYNPTQTPWIITATPEPTQPVPTVTPEVTGGPYPEPTRVPLDSVVVEQAIIDVMVESEARIRQGCTSDGIGSYPTETSWVVKQFWLADDGSVCGYNRTEVFRDLTAATDQFWWLSLTEELEFFGAGRVFQENGEVEFHRYHGKVSCDQLQNCTLRALRIVNSYYLGEGLNLLVDVEMLGQGQDNVDLHMEIYQDGYFWPMMDKLAELNGQSH